MRLDDPADELQKAQSLSRASAFLHISAREDFPLPVAQAMSAGVPCLVSDTPAHRALIRHGETGFVCTSERDFVEKLVLLLRDRNERARVGESARAEAERRFTMRHFEGALLRAYGLFARRPAPAGTAGALHLRRAEA
jgi:glycosyltransferase involved in cell wall biosynthesis